LCWADLVLAVLLFYVSLRITGQLTKLFMVSREREAKGEGKGVEASVIEPILDLIFSFFLFSLL
jgi:hypothetical protein